MATPLTTAYKPWIDGSDGDLADFRTLVLRDTDLGDYRHASDVRSNVLIYSAAATLDADQAEVRATVVLFDDLVGEADEGALDL